MLSYMGLIGALAFWGLAFYCVASFAGTTLGDGYCEGRPEYIADADTIWMRCKGKRIKVRLAQIDAPEASHRTHAKRHGQPYGAKATKALRRLISWHKVRIEWDEVDQYGRVVGEVYLGETHINAWLVENGYAWVYNNYVTDKSLYTLQNRAKKNRVGLWADPDPTPPWIWRRSRAR